MKESEKQEENKEYSRHLARITSGVVMKDPDHNENVEFRINLQDLAEQYNADSAYIRTDIGRSRTNTNKH